MDHSVLQILEWIAIVFLVALSGLFSGLNLGLMGLDPTSLEIVMSGGEPNNKFAKKIKPLRDQGNWLLCTLLLGNVAVNTALSILLANNTSPITGFLLSTTVIVIFGEIIPQALCSRYALLIGSHTVYIVWVLMAMMSVLAYPMAMILDKVLGDELGTIYSKKELRKLVDIHAGHDGTGINPRTANIMKGALDLQDAIVGDVMTDIKDVFWLDEQAKLTFDVLTKVFKSGHSRIPIMKKSHTGQPTEICGVLYAKDLVLLDPDDEISVIHIINTFRYSKPHFVEKNTTLDQCLKIFVHSRRHLCVVKAEDDNTGSDNNKRDVEDSRDSDNNSMYRVRKNNTAFENYLAQKGDKSVGGDDMDRSRDNTYNHNIHPNHRQSQVQPTILGIITLEDVIELALQTQLVDEHDVFIDHKHVKQTNRLATLDWNVLQMFDHRHRVVTSLPPQELQAVYHFLSQSVRVFMPKHRKCNESSIKNLLASSTVMRIDVTDDFALKSNSNESTDQSNKHKARKKTNRDPYRDIEDNGLLLYERHKRSDYFTLLLDGKCEIYAGRQGFRSTLSRWTYLCPDALETVQQCVSKRKPLLDYVPDFTCKVVENARILRVKITDFKACLEGQFAAYDIKEMSRGFSEPAFIRSPPKSMLPDNQSQNTSLSQSRENESVLITERSAQDSPFHGANGLQYRYKPK